MDINRSLLVLIFVNSVLHAMAKVPKHIPSYSLGAESNLTAASFKEAVDFVVLAGITRLEDEQIVIAPSSKNFIAGDAEAESHKGAKKRITRLPVPGSMDYFFQFNKRNGRLGFNPKFGAFLDELSDCIEGFLIRVPIHRNVRYAHFITAIEKDWQRKSEELQRIVLHILLNTTSADDFVRLWRALNDLDLDPTAVKQLPSDEDLEFRQALTKLIKSNSSKEGEQLWRSDSMFWTNLSSRARYLLAQGTDVNDTLLPAEKEVLRELSKLSPEQRKDWEGMLENRFFTRGKKGMKIHDRPTLPKEIFQSCQWIMRVERHEHQTSQLVNYLSYNWRVLKRLYSEDTKLPDVLNSFCVAVTRLLTALDPRPLYAWYKPEDLVGELSKEEYHFYLDFIQQQFKGRQYGDIGRVLIAQSYIDENGPLRL